MGNTQNELLEKYRIWLKVKRGNSEKTISNEIAFLRVFLTWLSNKKLGIDCIDQDTINQYLLYCHTKYSRNTLVPITISLKKFCRHFLGKDVVIKVAGVKAPNIDKTALTKKEIDAMFTLAKENHLKTAVLKTLYYTGIRQSELVDLDLTDVDFDRLQIIIRHGKGDRRRTVNITKTCALAIEQWLRVRPTPQKGHEAALFLLQSGCRISKYYLWNMVKTIAAKAEIKKNVYPHKFRITMITHMAEAGLSPREIQIQSGHRNIGTLLGYIQHCPERIRKSYDHVFDDAPQGDITIQDRHRLDNGYYKRMVMEKYLAGEIDIDMVHTIMTSLEEKNPKKKTSGDPSYA